MNRSAFVVAVGVTIGIGCTALVGLDKEYVLDGLEAGPEDGGSGSAGGNDSPDSACVPSANSEPVGGDCGVFVAFSGDDANEGTKEKPVKTLAKAIELSQDGTGSVYACAQAFPEAVEVPAGTAIFGGLDCQSDWGYVGKQTRTTIAPGPDMVPLKLLTGGGTVRLQDVDAHAADASLPGRSSIAVIADGAKAEIARCDFIAGAGAAGEKGGTPADPVGPSDPNDATIKGESGANACMGGAAGTPGGAAIENQLCITSIRGSGGAGGVTTMNGASGANGAQVGDLSKGLGGAGDMGTGCDPGASGQLGASGSPGIGATELGTISASGYTGAPGKPGEAGSAGQGGGGGGGARGKLACNGASGGSGGAGGCGGGSGLGGLGGGASIAFISLKADLSFTDVTLQAGDGGAGGEGGDGQGGGKGGNGGDGGFGAPNPNATLDACNGGKGGFGGSGGKGGGGRGGHSLGIAFTGQAPPKPTIKIGMAGISGIGADASGNGATGVAGEMLAFPSSM